MITKTKATRFLRSSRLFVVALLSSIREIFEPLSYVFGLAFVFALRGMPLHTSLHIAFRVVFGSLFCILLCKAVFDLHDPEDLSAEMRYQMLPLFGLLWSGSVLSAFGIME